MPKVEFGPLYTTMEKYIGPVEFAEKAEQWGYDYYWVPDYVTLSPMDAFVLLSAVGQRTTSIKLGTAVVVVPFRTPFQLAKASATVDVLSGGRFTLGVGIGGAVPRDFDVAQVDMRKRGRISNESLHITRRLLNEENVSHRGHYYSFDDLTIEPRPVQEPSIPIWIGSIWNNGFPQGVVDRAARYGDGFYPADASVEEFKKVQERIRARAAELGRDPDSIQWGLLAWTCPGSSKEDARQTASREISKRLESEWDVQADNGYILGTPEEMAETLQGYVDIGVTNFVVDPACAPEDMLEMFGTFAKEVVPHFRSADS